MAAIWIEWACGHEDHVSEWSELTLPHRATSTIEVMPEGTRCRWCLDREGGDATPQATLVNRVAGSGLPMIVGPPRRPAPLTRAERLDRAGFYRRLRLAREGAL